MRCFFKVLWVAVFAATPLFAQDRMGEILRLIDAQEFDAAQEKISEAPIAPFDLAYLNARAELVKGNLDRGIDLLRDLLRQQPQALLPRQDLAAALERRKSYLAAEAQYRRLFIQDGDPARRQAYVAAIRRIAALRPFGVSGFLTFAPSQNINRATFQEFLFGIENFRIDATEESGIGIFTGVNGFFRHKMSDRDQLRLDWQVSGKFYDGRNFDEYSGYIGLNYIRTGEKFSFNIGPYGRRSWNHNISTEIPEWGLGTSSRGVRLGYARQVGETNNLRFDITREIIDDHRSFGADGDFNALAVTWRKVLNPTTALSTKVTFSDLDRNVTYNGYRGRELRLTLDNVWPEGVATSFGLYYGYRDYKALFGFTNITRRDDYTGVTLDATINRFQIFNLVPKIGCRFEGGRSNIEFGDVNIRECALTLTQNF